MNRFGTALALAACISAAPALAQTQQASGYYVNIGGYLVDWGYQTINLNAAQSRGLTGSGQTVAVFDTGINNGLGKFTLANGGYNIYTGGSVQGDPNGHGTFVSSIIAANMRNTTGTSMYGVASSARLVSVQMLDSSGVGTATDAQLATGIAFATNSGARVFNNSWGATQTLAQLGAATVLANNARSLSAWEAAASRGAVMVFAAGNSGASSPDFYATMPSIDSKLQGSWLVVGAIDTNGKLASWSNACGIASSYCLVAPGSQIVGIYGTQLALGSGTSFAAPMVSGGVALLQQLWPYLSNKQIVSILLTTANRSGVYANSAIYGQGLMDLNTATKPVGSLSVPTGATVADNSVPLGVMTMPAAFGKISAAGSQLMTIDDYGRAYTVPLASLVSNSVPSMTLDASFARFSGHGMIVQAAQDIKLGLVSDGNEITGAATPLALSALGNPYLSMGRDAKMMFSWGDMIMWHGGPTADNTTDTAALSQSTQPTVDGAVYRLGDLQLGWVHEDNSLYGSPAAPATALASGEDTAFAAWSRSVDMGDRWRIDASASVGVGKLNGYGSLVTNIEPMIMSSAAVGVSRSAVFADDDRLGLVASMPNHSISGSAQLWMPTAVDGLGNVSYGTQRLDLTANATEVDIQAYWQRNTGDSSVKLAAGLRSAPDGDASAPTQGVAMIHYSLQF